MNRRGRKDRRVQRGSNNRMAPPPPAICPRLQADIDAGRGDGTNREMAELIKRRLASKRGKPRAR